jgi:capsular polysaccharide transport system permease protein
MSAVDLALPATPVRVHRRRLAGLRTIGALMLREMSTTYGRSPGGYLWVVLEPVAGTLLMTLAFAAFLRSPPLGTNFPLFYATGIVPFLTYTNISNSVAQSLNFSRPLLVYPSVTWLDAILARFVLNFLTELMVAYLILAGLMLVYDTRVILDLPTIALAMALSGALAFGIGVLNCFLVTRFPIWQRSWAVMMRPMVLISGVMILHETVPQPLRGILEYNPLIHITGLMRRGFYATYDASYVSIGYVLGISAVCAVLGLVFLGRYHRDLINLRTRRQRPGGGTDGGGRPAIRSSSRATKDSSSCRVASRSSRARSSGQRGWPAGSVPTFR